MTSERKQIVNRLRTLAGHVRGVEEMVLNERPCEDILHQVHALSRSLAALQQKIFENYLNECTELDQPEARDKLLKVLNTITK